MKIRRATLDDVATIVEFGRVMHAESPRWRRLSFSPAKVAQMMEMLISNEEFGFVAVAVSDEKIVGAVAAYVAEEWCSWDRVANEMALFVEPTGRGAQLASRLIQAMDEWAQSRGALGLQAGATTGIEIERTAQLYERLGFIRCAIGVERFYH